MNREAWPMIPLPRLYMIEWSRLKPPQTGLDRDDDRWKFYPRERFVKHQRKLFAKYGYDSGVDPGVMWPSIEELEDIIEEERELEPTLQELWAQAKANREAREKEIMERYMSACRLICEVLLNLDILILFSLASVLIRDSNWCLPILTYCVHK